jgi:hypothetical protein
MIIRNKKNGTNTLAFENTRVIIKAGETIDIPSLVDFNQIINKADFGLRGWFEVVEKTETLKIKKEETSLEKAKKEVKEYTSKQKNTEE